MTRTMEMARGQEMYTEHRTESGFYRLSRLCGGAYERTGWLIFDRMALTLWRLSQVDADAVYALVILMAGCMAVGLLLGMHSATRLIETAQTAYKPHDTYARAMVVTDVHEDGSVSLRTATGLVYSIDGLDDGDIAIGDVYACLMDDMGTPDDVRDDTIVNVRYERIDMLQDGAEGR